MAQQYKNGDTYLVGSTCYMYWNGMSVPCSDDPRKKKGTYQTQKKASQRYASATGTTSMVKPIASTIIGGAAGFAVGHFLIKKGTIVTVISTVVLAAAGYYIGNKI